MRSQISFLIKCLVTDSTYELRVPATTVQPLVLVKTLRSVVGVGARLALEHCTSSLPLYRINDITTLFYIKHIYTKLLTVTSESEIKVLAR